MSSRDLSAPATLRTPYDEVWCEARGFIPHERLISDPLRLLTWGTDASFYRLVPALVVVVEREDEVRRLLAVCARHRTSVTFRAAGTSLSGQAITDSVLVLLGDGWRTCAVGDDAQTITLGPGVIGGEANRRLSPHGCKLGPDPASIDAAMIGGIAANNASGMCCGTAQNSYHTLSSIRIVLADGTVLDTGDPSSRRRFAAEKRETVRALDALAGRVREDAVLAARIRHKFRMKNTTGYGINALVDFCDPIDILAHLMIGSEGTLGFISEITYRTVPDFGARASALVLFHDLETACRAVTALAAERVDAVELADRAALRAVEAKPGMPAGIGALGPSGAALLIEVRAPDPETLAAQIHATEAALALLATAAPVRFSTDAGECAQLWNVRKGMFPSVGAVRKTGTTVIIEDVALPVERLAEATLDLQRLLRAHGYGEAIIFGHALAGNLHFVFTQDFNAPAEVERYRRFMDELCQMVVERYDGSLKAEHGTGRNIAPFVALEWGAAAHEVMREIKRILDPQGLLNPGVILNDDPEAHLQNLKPMPVANPLIDQCIECGFCEPKCPSRGLTLSPRQRIAGWRQTARLTGTNAPEGGVASWRRLYDYHGIDTCAGCGLCATACPVGIETGGLIKELRGRRHGALAAFIANVAADHYATVTAGVRTGLAAADMVHGALGRERMQRMTSALRRAAGDALPKWSSAVPRPTRFRPARDAHGATGERAVYFPSCAARNMAAQRGDDARPLPVVTERLLHKAGYDVIYPEALDALCCGQPFESKGFAAAADRKSRELERALSDASEGGRLPIVCDTSPCTYRMRQFAGERLRMMDAVEFIHDAVLSRVAIAKDDAAVAIHPVCSVRKMGTVQKLAAIAKRCAREVITVDDVLCCGFAGEKGFTRPELNEHALRRLRDALPAGCTRGYSSSRTCEIGLSEQAGFPYRSIIDLVDACAVPRGSAANAGGKDSP